MIIITGASRGLGKFVFNHYVKIGEKVIGTYLNTSPAKENIGQIHKVDVSDLHSVKDFIEGIRIDLENIVLINCAGTSYNSFAHKADLVRWINVINTNLVGSFLMIHGLLPIMREQNYGRIINFSSVLSKMGVPGTSAYSTSKSGLQGMVKSLAQENGNKGITINNIDLGYFSVGMIEQVPDEIQNKMMAQIPGKRFGDPEEIINTIDYILKTPYVNGASLDLNGGLL